MGILYSIFPLPVLVCYLDYYGSPLQRLIQLFILSYILFASAPENRYVNLNPLAKLVKVSGGEIQGSIQ